MAAYATSALRPPPATQRKLVVSRVVCPVGRYLHHAVSSAKPRTSSLNMALKSIVGVDAR